MSRGFVCCVRVGERFAFLSIFCRTRTRTLSVSVTVVCVRVFVYVVVWRVVCCGAVVCASVYVPYVVIIMSFGEVRYMRYIQV